MTATRKRKRLIPANIATMNDKERWDWYSSLTDDECDKVQGCTFKDAPEYWVYLQTKTEGRELMETWSTLEAAMKMFNELKAERDTVAVEVEKVIDHRSVVDADLKYRDYKAVASFGEFIELDPE